MPFDAVSGLVRKSDEVAVLADTFTGGEERGWHFVETEDVDDLPRHE